MFACNIKRWERGPGDEAKSNIDLLISKMLEPWPELDQHASVQIQGQSLIMCLYAKCAKQRTFRPTKQYALISEHALISNMRPIMRKYSMSVFCSLCSDSEFVKIAKKFYIHIRIGTRWYSKVMY